jgi:quercetin dioxygenase-like cupin family protein
MKTFTVVLGCLAFLVGPAARGEDKPRHADDAKHVAVRPDEVRWGPPPPSLPPGCQVAVVVGDPRKAGVPYVMRVKLPDGYKVPPHWHPVDENVTVLRGTFLMGRGERLDPSAMEELPAGSFVHMPKGMRHYAMAQGETVIQTHGIGPFEINYVNTADDPRK